VHEDQLHYPVYYAIGREGKAWDKMPDNPSEPANLDVIFDAITSHIPAPKIEDDKLFPDACNCPFLG
jgi:GTP-binding protein